MERETELRRPTRRTVLVTLASASSLSILGCGGEREAPIASTDKNRDELQKEIENPYGVEIKSPQGKGKSSRAK